MPAKKTTPVQPAVDKKEAYYQNLSERSERWRTQTLINQGEWLDRNEAVLTVLGQKIDELFWLSLEADADTLYSEIDDYVPVFKAISQLLMEAGSTRFYPAEDVSKFDGSVKLLNRFAVEEHRYTEVLPKLDAINRPTELDKN